jgi:hypothetical protein
VPFIRKDVKACLVNLMRQLCGGEQRHMGALPAAVIAGSKTRRINRFISPTQGVLDTKSPPGRSRAWMRASLA